MLTQAEADALKADLDALVDQYTEGVEPPIAEPEIRHFTAIPASIEAGQQAVLHWDTENAPSVTINGEAVNADGSLAVTPSVTQAYELRAVSPTGEAVQTVTVTVTPAPPPPDPDVVGDVMEAGVHHPEEIHVHAGKSLTIMPGATWIRPDVPPADPDHANGGLVVHGKLIAVSRPGQDPIVIRSENPTGHRGHIMIHKGGRAELEGVQILDFGRTTWDPINNTTNPLGFYALHWHLAGDVAGDRVERCEIFDTVPSIWRHGLVLHGTHKVLVRLNRIDNKAGTGIYLEDGTERENVLELNEISNIRGSAQFRLDRRPRDPSWVGCGILAAGGANYIRHNRVTNATYGGYVLYFYTRDSIKDVLEFLDNSVDGTRSAVEYWYLGGSVSAPTILDGLTARNCSHTALNHYPSGPLVLRNADIADCRYGWLGGDYWAQHVRIEGGTFARCRNAIVPSTVMTAGEFILDGVEFGQGADANDVDIYTRTVYKGGGANQVQPRIIRARSCTFGGKLHVMRAFWPTETAHYLQTDRLILEDYQGEDLEVYYNEQAPDAIVPSAGHALSIGSQEPGLTNAQHWTKYGTATGGAVAPCTTKRPEIDGLVCPLAG